MHSYMTGFAVYTLAMTGVIFVAFIVAKKCMLLPNGKSKNNFLQVENHMPLEPGKSLYVVKAGKERFLIASSRESCQFMSKLEEHNFLEDLNKDLDNDRCAVRTLQPQSPMDDTLGKISGKDIVKHFTGVF
jgi:flagellar biogenesis protein FliO